MSTRRKRAAVKAAKTGASGIGHILLLILKAIGILALIGVTTGAIFACIFVIYIQNNLVSSDLGIDLDEISLHQTSVIYYYDNDTGSYEELVSLKSTSGDSYWVDYEDIPLDLEHAVVVIEDQRFYKHNGVDWYRTAGAFVNMFVGMKDTFGGSTITQQLVKNSTGYDDVTVTRKLTEIFSALEMEKKYEKWEIIEYYLNIVYFGHNNYGIGAAAKYYFSKDVSELSLAEMCSIVAITNNPSLYSPKLHADNNKTRQELILAKMLELGYITQEEHDAAVAEELNFTFITDSSSSGEVYTWFEEAVISDVTEYLAESRGISTRDAQTLLLNAGYRIYATIDVEIQACVDQIYEDLEQIPSVSGSDEQFQSAIVITDPYTGNIVAMAGGVGEKTADLLLNRATDSRRPPGSSLKPLSVYAPAMDMGIITPDTVYEDEADIVLDGTDWFPHNDNNQNRGPVTIRQAIISSLNTIAAQVLDDLTPAASYSFLTNKLGFELDEADMDYAPLALGQLTYGVTVREMATAFSIFPTNGMYTESRTFSHIYDSDGNLIYENVSESHAVISEATAYWMTDILTDAATYGTGYEANLDNMPTAGKTGTTSSKADRWFVGFTPYYVAAVWTGYDTPASITANGNPAAQLWNKVMTLVHENLEYKDFTVPENTYLEPVDGVEIVSYYIRGISVDDVGGVTILYEEEVDERAVGREVTVTAKELDGYDLVGDSTATITLSSDPEDNVAEFRYVSNVPVEPDEPDEPDDPGGTDEPDDPDTPDEPGDTGQGDTGGGSEDGDGGETPDIEDGGTENSGE